MNEETKDCTRLPVVGVVNVTRFKNNPAMENVEFQLAADIPQGQHDVCRLTDAQARLAEKDARIAQLAAHARGKNKALANALKEIERLRLNIAEYNEHESCWRAEIANLRAQLEQLQAAPAERGAPDETAMARALCNYHADLCGVNRDDQWNLYSEDFLNDVAVMLAADRRLNPAPATADSDVREVKE